MDEEKDTPGAKPPGEDEDIQIEFVDHEEPAGLPAAAPLPAGLPGEGERETGLVEIDMDAQEAQDRERDEQIERLQDQVLRARADFQNYKRRVERDRDGEVRGAIAKAIRELLPVLDNLDRALNTLESEAPPGWCKGLELVRQQFHDVLSRQGVARIESSGQPFDPSLHEAVMTAWDPGKQEGVVLSVLEEGYMIEGKLLRPARVSVNRRPEETAEESPGA